MCDARYDSFRDWTTYAPTASINYNQESDVLVHKEIANILVQLDKQASIVRYNRIDNYYEI